MRYLIYELIIPFIGIALVLLYLAIFILIESIRGTPKTIRKLLNFIHNIYRFCRYSDFRKECFENLFYNIKYEIKSLRNESFFTILKKIINIVWNAILLYFLIGLTLVFILNIFFK